jgi:hypothetical protein
VWQLVEHVWRLWISWDGDLNCIFGVDNKNSGYLFLTVRVIHVLTEKRGASIYGFALLYYQASSCSKLGVHLQVQPSIEPI